MSTILASDQGLSPKRETLRQRLEMGRRDLGADAAPRPSGPAKPPRSYTMRYLLANTEPSPRMLLLLAGLLAAFRLLQAIRLGQALLRTMGLLRTPAQPRLPAPAAAYTALP